MGLEEVAGGGSRGRWHLGGVLRAAAVVVLRGLAGGGERLDGVARCVVNYGSSFRFIVLHMSEVQQSVVSVAHHI